MVVIRIARGGTGSTPNAILDNQNNDFNAFFQDIDGIAVPANPAAGHRRLFVDSADDIIKVRTAGGATVSLEAGAGGGEANTSSNSGAGDGWALAKVGVDLPFKSLITTAPISTTVNAADLTLVLAALVNADIAGGAAIAYSKLNLTGLVVNADINAAAAIAYAKLNLTGLVVNADINAAAAIATTKLADSANFVLSDQNNDLNAFFQDLDGIAVPANPAAGHRRLFVDSADDVLKVRTAGGVTTSLEAGSTPNAILDNQNNDFNAFFQDIDGIAVPANPAAGHRRLFVDSADDVLKVRTAGGVTTSLEQGGGGAGLVFAKSVKIVDETVNNSAVLQDDDVLKFTPSINTVYHVQLMIFYLADSTPDIKYAFSIPAGATMTFLDANIDWQAAAGSAGDATSAKSSNGLGSTVATFMQMCVLEMGGTAGDCIMQWAQNTANVSDTKVLLGSMLIAYEEGTS